jgi:formate hydrogenlyase transcriptional activator
VHPLYIAATDLDLQQCNALLSAADLVRQHYRPDELFGELIPNLQSVVPFDLLTFAVLSGPEKVKLEYWEGFHRSVTPVEVALDDSVVGAVWRSQTVRTIDDVASETRFASELRWLGERDIKSYCVVPLTNLNQKLGALGFGRKQARAFPARDITFLQVLSQFIAPGTDKAVLDETVADEIGRFRLLIEIVRCKAANTSFQECVTSIIQSLQKWAGEDLIGIYLYDQGSQSLRLQMPENELAAKMAPQGGLTPIEGTLAGQAFRSGRTLILDYPSLVGLNLDSVKRGLQLGVRTLNLTPLRSSNNIFGVLKVARRRDVAFSSRDVEFLEEVAARIASALRWERSGRALATEREKAGALKSGDSVSATPGNPSHTPIGLAPVGFAAADRPDALWAAEALIKSDEFRNAYLKASNVGFCVLDSDFHYLAVNETLARMNGLPVAAHLGKTVRDVLGDFAEVIEPQFRKVVATGQPIVDLEISFVLPTRSEPGHWIEHYLPIKDPAGKVAQIGIIAMEVTEQKRLEESLRSVSENLRREKKRQEVLMEATQLLATNWDVGKVFPQVSAYLRRVLRHEYAAFSLREEGSGSLIPQALDFPMGKSPDVGGEIGTAKSVGGKALQEGSSVILTRDELQQLDPGIAANLHSEGLKSLCCVPLFRPKGPLGMLVLGSTRAEAFRSDDLTLLNQVAALLAIALENSRAAREVERLKQRLKQEKRYLAGAARSSHQFDEIIGESPALRQVLDQIAVISSSDATVVILGETGTGKGLVARAIHRMGKRKGRGFVVLNCAAIPTGLLESELFGHEKGAFTGAVNQKMGRLELADQGTLFLDEIGEIPLELQPKLLRVLQDHEFERLGGTKTIKVDLRVIAATNRDLAKSVAQKQFRSDLFYRLNVFPIRIPSLRERREDIALLVRYFVHKFSKEMGRKIETIPRETMEALAQWHWPGNVRELENFIERSVILTEGSALRAPLEEFRAEIAQAPEGSLRETEREHIIRVLGETGGMISGPTGAAARLGLKRTTLQSKMQRLGITRKDYSGKKQE